MQLAQSIGCHRGPKFYWFLIYFVLYPPAWFWEYLYCSRMWSCCRGGHYWSALSGNVCHVPGSGYVVGRGLLGYTFFLSIQTSPFPWMTVFSEVYGKTLHNLLGLSDRISFCMYYEWCGLCSFLVIRPLCHIYCLHCARNGVGVSHAH